MVIWNCSKKKCLNIILEDNLSGAVFVKTLTGNIKEVICAECAGKHRAHFKGNRVKNAMALLEGNHTTFKQMAGKIRQN